MAHKKAGGSSKNGQRFQFQEIGCQAFWWPEFVKPGEIIIRQRGTNTHPGSKTSEWVKIIHYSLLQPVKCNSLTKASSKKRQSTSFLSKS